MEKIKVCPVCGFVGYAEDAVEVVWCKDCKWYDSKSKGCNRSGGLTMYPLYEYDYCSYGERKGGDSE